MPLQDPLLLLAIAEPLITTARAQNQLQAEQLISACHQGAQVQQQAEQIAAELRDKYYSLTAQLKEARAACVSTSAARCIQGQLCFFPALALLLVCCLLLLLCTQQH